MTVDEIVNGCTPSIKGLRTARSYLITNLVPCNDDGYYHVKVDANYIRKLMLDPSFVLLIGPKGIDMNGIITILGFKLHD